MAEGATPNEKPPFDISRVFNGTFSGIRQNFMAFFFASFFIVGLPQFLMGLWPLFIDITDDDFASNIEGMLGLLIMVGGLSAPVIMFLQFLLQGTIIHASIAAFNQEQVSFKQSVSVALRYIWPLIGFSLLFALGSLGGFLLLIVPGIILMLMWCVGIPAMITEGLGVGDSFSRSNELTSGYKGWIFLLMLIFGIISAIISAVGAVVMSTLGGSMEEMIMSGENVSNTYWIVNAVMTAIVQIFSVMVSAVGTAAIYYELRFIKEGVGPKSIAAVFD